MKRRLRGKVVSTKMEKTASVLVERHKVHPLYNKRFIVSKKFLSHNEIGAQEGDKVIIEESKPISKNKRWVIVENLSSNKKEKK